MYKIQITRSAQKSLAKIPPPYRSKIILAIQNLAENPYAANSKKISGRDAYLAEMPIEYE